MSGQSPEPTDDPLARLARETGRRLGELGLKCGDDRWIRRHAETLAGLVIRERRSRGIRGLAARLYRLAFHAARTAR